MITWITTQEGDARPHPRLPQDRRAPAGRRRGLKPTGVFAIGLLAAAGALLSAAMVSATSQRATRPLDTYTAGPVSVNMTEVGGQVTFQVTGLSIYNAFFDTDRTSATGSAFDHGAECALNEVSTTGQGNTFLQCYDQASGWRNVSRATVNGDTLTFGLPASPDMSQPRFWLTSGGFRYPDGPPLGPGYFYYPAASSPPPPSTTAPTTTTTPPPPAPTLKVGGVKLAVNKAHARLTAAEIFAWSDGSAVSGRVTVCKARLANKPLKRLSTSLKKGIASCSFALPPRAKGKATVWVTTAVTGAKPVTKSASTAIH
jgi:hypothetical protein